jgi:hypothetical protein
MFVRPSESVKEQRRLPMMSAVHVGFRQHATISFNHRGRRPNDRQMLTRLLSPPARRGKLSRGDTSAVDISTVFEALRGAMRGDGSYESGVSRLESWRGDCAGTEGG